MSEIRVNDIIAKGGTSAPTLVYGAQVPTGMGITGAGGINVTGVITATTGAFTNVTGDGSALTGISVTSYIDSVNLTVSGITTTNGLLDANAEVTAAGGVDIAGGLKVGAASTLAAVNVGSNQAITLGTGATITSPATNIITAGTASTEVVRINANAGIILNNGLLSERIKIDSDSINTDKFIRLQDGMVHYRSSAVGAASVKPDIVSTTGINTDMGIGDVIAVTLITVAGNTAHFVSSVAIDGRTTGISTYWAGGSTPDAGGGSNVDIYAFSILKTADNTFTVIANQTLTSA